MSYVRFNDQHDDGQLSLFRERLEAETRAQTGRVEFTIFQDRDIAWGQNWQQRIDEALDTVTLLLVIITPGLFHSRACRDEVRKFVERERALHRADLILPVYYITAEEMEDPGLRETDEMAQVLASRQYADWRELRFERLTSPLARKEMAQLALRMRAMFWLPPAPPARPAGSAREAGSSAGGKTRPDEEIPEAKGRLDTGLTRREGRARERKALEGQVGHDRPTASHFARLSYAWGTGMTANRGSYEIDGVRGIFMPEDRSDYLQGSVAVSCPDIGPTTSYGRVFDLDFQRSVALLQERNILRRGGHSFHTREAWTRSSYLVYGEIVQHYMAASYIGVEVHDYGAVSVYFKEYTSDATLDEVVGWWVLGALWMALEVHTLLGTTGSVHAAVLFNDACLSDSSDKGLRKLPRSPFYSDYNIGLKWLLHGPFSLLPPEREDEDGEERYHWPWEAAARELIPIGTSILGKGPDESGDWSPWSARDRLGGGRDIRR
jgi:hypothetical protein